MVACEVVWTEIASGFGSGSDAARMLDSLGISFAPLDRADALSAGEAFRAYRDAGGKRERVVADFLIGAHAAANADRLLTRDRGFFRTYFASVEVFDPSA